MDAMKKTRKVNIKKTERDTFERNGYTILGKETDLMTCHQCKRELNHHYFRIGQVDHFKRRRLKHICTPCDDKNIKVVRALKKMFGNTKTEGCEICKRTDKKLTIDHCHKTNKFRGWLCLSCNTSLGRFEDDPQQLINAIEYLLKDPIPQPDIEINDQMELKFNEME